MLHELASAPPARAIFAQASDLLGVDVYLYDSAAALEQTSAAQLQLFLAGVASARSLQDAGLSIGAVAGHSVGAIAAATATGALTFEDALRLVVVRGNAMASRFAHGFAMGVISGLQESTVRELLPAESPDDEELAPVYVSAINAPDQVTIAGRAQAVEGALDDAIRHGARSARRLAVDVPSHTPYMEPVRELLRAALASMTLGKTTMPYAANGDGRAKTSSEDIARDLADSVARTVRWHDATEMLYERGVRRFVETVPGDVLTRLARSAFPDSVSMAAESAGTAAVVRYLSGST